MLVKLQINLFRQHYQPFRRNAKIRVLNSVYVLLAIFVEQLTHQFAENYAFSTKTKKPLSTTKKEAYNLHVKS